MDIQERIKLLQQYSSEKYLQQFWKDKTSFVLPEKNKQELLEALGNSLLQVKDENTPWGIQFNASMIEIFCNQVLKALSLQIPESLKLPEDFEQVKSDFIQQQFQEFQDGIRIWYISENSETLEHTKENKLNYQSGNFLEKWKAMFGYKKNFTPRADKPQQIKMFNQVYLPLNPDKLQEHPQLLDFILHGNFHKGYPFTEKKLLIYKMMENADVFKEKLFNYEVLVIPTEDWYSEEISERILIYPGVNEEGNRYLIAENTPEVYKEKHLRKYTWNTIRFTPFLDKASALSYLFRQLDTVKNQLQRIDEITTKLEEMKSFPDIEEVNTLLEEALHYFSYYKSKADQEIVYSCGKALTNHNESNRNQILKSMISKLPTLKVEAEKKLNIMTKHFEAFRDNSLL